MQKRGQVTVFIVVGIVVLAVFAFLFFLRGKLVETSFEDEMNALVVPRQLEPVKTYIDVCLSQKVQEGVNLLGEQGGYIELPEDIMPRSYTNPFSNTLEVYDGAEVAYWYYETANGIETQNVPSLQNMQTQLEEYLDNNFKDCFYDLTTFEEEGFQIIKPTTVKSEVTINKNNIQVKVISSVYLSLKDVNKNLEKQMVVVNSNLGELYSLAKDIYEKENKDKFLEEKTIDMMVVYDEIPYSTTEFSCERKIWQKSTVIEDMKWIINANIAALRLKPITSSSYLEPIPEYFKIDVQKSPGISEQFQYFTSWPLQVDVSPTKGDILVGDPLTQSVPEISKFLNLFFCLNNYHFVYDIKYPVLISLSDDTGFTFQFANMVKIDNNKPRKFEGEVSNYETTTEFDSNFCSNAVIPVEVSAYDYEDLSDVSGASILYKCFSTTCYIGETDSNGKLIANFPPCLNGAIIAQRQGYEMSTDLLSTNSQDTITLLLDRHHELDLDLRSISMDDGATRPITNYQTVVQFENLEDGYTTMVTQEDSKITLTSGTYKITAYLLSEEGVQIDLKTDSFVQCIEVPKPGFLGLFFKEEKCFSSELEGDTLTDAIIGGAIFEWDADLENANKLTVYIPYNRIPRTQSQMIEIFNDIQTNSANTNFRYPILE